MTDSFRYPYQLVRSNRRTLSLSLDERGGLTARAPRRMPVCDIERFIMQKSGWLEKKREQLARRMASVSRYALEDGARLPYLGGEIRIGFANVVSATMHDGTLCLPARSDALTHALRWFSARAQEELLPRVRDWAKRMNVYPSSVGFGHAKRRWGSMSATGAMRLNIALLHCDPALIDYVIVHELAHRVHPNHSKAFHAYVESVLPGAATRRAALKTAAAYLELLRPNPKEARE